MQFIVMLKMRIIFGLSNLGSCLRLAGYSKLAWVLIAVSISTLFEPICCKRKHMRVTSVLIEPYLMINPVYENRTGNERYMGYIADLMKHLAETVGFQYRLHLARDNHYGSRKSDNSWDGMIGELQRKDADIAAAPLYITDVRKEVVQFTKPFITVEAAVLISNSDLNINREIRTVRDLVLQNDIDIGTLNTGVIVHAFKHTNDSDYKQMWEDMKHKRPSVFTDTNLDGINRVRAGGYAFVLPSTIGDYISMQAPCDLTVIDRFLMKRDFALALPKDSYLLNDINKGLDMLDEMGTLNRLYRTWWADHCGLMKSEVNWQKYTNNALRLNQNLCLVAFISLFSIYFCLVKNDML